MKCVICRSEPRRVGVYPHRRQVAGEGRVLRRRADAQHRADRLQPARLRTHVSSQSSRSSAFAVYERHHTAVF